MPSNQSLTVEYLVSGDLDGTTPAPPVVIDQSAENATPFDADAQVYRLEVDNLGLIDPDLGVGGSIGARCIPFLWVDTEELGETGAAVEVVGMRGEAAKVQRTVADLEGQAGAFLDGNFNVAQGSAIRLSGFTAGPEGLLVRVSIMVPTDCADFSLAVLARDSEAPVPPAPPSGGAPARAIFPVFDGNGPVGGPGLSYKVEGYASGSVIVIRGKNLTGIVAVDVSTDVRVPPNDGDPPVIAGTPVYTDESITVTLDAPDSESFDFWGVQLTDSDGNVYAAPSPIKIYIPE